MIQRWKICTKEGEVSLTISGFRSKNKIRLIKRIITKIVLENFSSRNRTKMFDIVIQSFPSSQQQSKNFFLKGSAKLISSKVDSKNQVIMKINSSLNYRQLVLTVSHEMCHVKQFLDNKLIFTNKLVKWRTGSRLRLFPFKGAGYNMYSNFPWEVEADRFALKVLTKWKFHNH